MQGQGYRGMRASQVGARRQEAEAAECLAASGWPRKITGDFDGLQQRKRAECQNITPFSLAGPGAPRIRVALKQELISSIAVRG